MSPQELLAHLDAGSFWPRDHDVAIDGDLDRAYRTALAVCALRESRGERIAGMKVGWTSREKWSRQGVSTPMWAALHASSIVDAGAACEIRLRWNSLPRLEPEVVMGLRAEPPAEATLEQVFERLDWIAAGFEIVQSHLPDWRYTPAQTIADGGVHARLIVGRRVPARSLAADGAALAALLAGATVQVSEGGSPRGSGRGEGVLGSPLEALRQGLALKARCPGAPVLRPGDLVTTGAWTEAFTPAPGQAWRAEFDLPIPPLRLALR